jgi:hypothetical protein
MMAYQPTARDMIAQCRGFMAQQEKRLQRQITNFPDRRIIHASDRDRVYVPSNTAKLFHEDRSFVKLVMGPFGSGKSTLCVQSIVDESCRMPRWFNGRRKSRWAIVRNTSGELQSTTLQTWLQWFGDLGDVRRRQKPLLTYEISFNDGEGTVELELIFIALDRPDDVRKIKSLELTGVYLNELSELPEAVLSHFKGRVNGRFPSKSFCPEPYWSGIICDTNPPDEDHWIYRTFEVDRVPSYRIFHQPAGLLISNDGTYTQNPNCDNAENLSPTYYLKLAEGQKQGFINVYCLGKYGLVESGKRVYPEYNDDIHGVESLNAIQGQPIHLGWDFGLTPACIVTQISPRGQLLVLKEYIATDMGIRTFANSIVLPQLAIDFPYNKIGESEADPSGSAGNEIMEELSCIGELNSIGIRTNPASSNEIDVRIGAVRWFLNTMIDGKPALLLDKTKCPVLRKGFMSGYHFKRVNIANEDRFQDKPNKNAYSHPHDGLQYNAMKFAGNAAAERSQPKQIVDVFNPVMGWS